MSRLLEVSRRFGADDEPKSRLQSVSQKFAQSPPRTTILPPATEIEENPWTDQFRDTDIPETQESPRIPPPPRAPMQTMPSIPMDYESQEGLGDVNVQPSAKDVLSVLMDDGQTINQFIADYAQGAVADGGQRYIYVTVDGEPLGQYRLTYLPRTDYPRVDKTPYQIHNVELTLGQITNWLKEHDPGAWEKVDFVMKHPNVVS